MTTIVLLVLVIALVGYIALVQPNRWRVPLHEALALLPSDDPDDLARADRLLGQAVAGGIRRRALGDARFAQAYVRARLGRYDPAMYGAAAASVADLVAADGYDRHTAYLDLWLQARLDQHDKVLDLFQQHRALLEERRPARLIAAIAALNKAVAHWRRREVEGALHYFDQLRELGELTDQIPAHVEDLQLVNGVQALFDGRAEDARRSFEGSLARAAHESRAQDSWAEATLGLIACDWESGPLDELDRRLGQVLDELGPAKAGDEEAVALRAHAALLHVVSLLRRWREQGAPDPRELDARVERTLAADAGLGDAHLIRGLIGYYFATGKDERDRAVAELERGVATAKGVTLREVLDLVDKERELADEKGTVARYVGLVEEYLADPSVPARHRAELEAIRRLMEPFLDPAAVAADLRPHENLTAEEQRDRSRLLGVRVNRILYGKVRDLAGDPRLSEIKDLSGRRQQALTGFNESERELREIETPLLKATGLLLLPEDPHG
ncbi:hypothetical protein [Nonomuraea roseola]|uniref:Uncharacterized protein n=1 Tax=Nonomuraea roseola TaxID=46179 RepID=A0ABV5QDY1_9ACTN